MKLESLFSRNILKKWITERDPSKNFINIELSLKSNNFVSEGVSKSNIYNILRRCK